MPLRSMRNSGWMHKSFNLCGSGVQRIGQGQSQQESGAERELAGHEITGSARLAFGKMSTTWLCISYLLPAAIQLLPWESFSYLRRGELLREDNSKYPATVLEHNGKI